MLVHGVWVRPGPGSNNTFCGIFFALQYQGKKGSESCQPILFLTFPIPQYQKEAEKGGRGISLVSGQSVVCETSPLWSVSVQIDNGRFRASAAGTFTADGGWVPCLPQHPTAATACPCAHPGGEAWVPQGSPGSETSWGCPGSATGAQLLAPRHGKPPTSMPQHTEHAILHTQSLLS